VAAHYAAFCFQGKKRLPVLTGSTKSQPPSTKETPNPLPATLRMALQVGKIQAPNQHQNLNSNWY